MIVHDPIAALDSALAKWPAQSLCVAYSGGMDSSALLHACAMSAAAQTRGLSAIHVDHGLHEHSAAWSEHCRAVADRLDVPLQILKVEVPAASSEGLEAAARRARYAAIEAALEPATLVLTAHHAEDQAETLLLRMLRGAGVNGLAAMRPLRRLGHCWLGRPWLDVPRASIRAHALHHGLEWIDDPANARERHDRNYLRHRVMPALTERWPSAAAQFASSAGLLAHAAGVVDRHTASLLSQAQGVDPATLQLSTMRHFDPYERAEILRAWFAQLALPVPDANAVEAIERSLIAARDDATPRVAWRGAELRRYRDLLYALAPRAALDRDWNAEWDGRSELALPGRLGRLALGAPEALSLRVCFRAGGERIRLSPKGRTQSLKNLLQELGVPPWERARLPLLFHADQLWAAGDVLVAAEFSQWMVDRSCAFGWTRQLL